LRKKGALSKLARPKPERVPFAVWRSQQCESFLSYRQKDPVFVRFETGFT
jgi:hypothetical protein